VNESIQPIKDAIDAFHHIITTPEFQQMERMRSKARNDLEQVLCHARQQEIDIWQPLIAEKDAKLADKELQIAELKNQLKIKHEMSEMTREYLYKPPAPELRRLDWAYSDALHDESAAIRHERTQEREKWFKENSEKDACLADKDLQIAELRAELETSYHIEKDLIAYYKVTSAWHRGMQVEREKWQKVIADKDADVENLRSRIAELENAAHE